jgi:hypothetical protein
MPGKGGGVSNQDSNTTRVGYVRRPKIYLVPVLRENTDDEMEGLRVLSYLRFGNLRCSLCCQRELGCIHVCRNRFGLDLYLWVFGRPELRLSTFVSSDRCHTISVGQLRPPRTVCRCWGFEDENQKKSSIVLIYYPPCLEL